MHLDNVPFDIVETKRLECQFGPLYYKESNRESTTKKVLQKIDSLVKSFNKNYINSNRGMLLQNVQVMSA